MLYVSVENYDHEEQSPSQEVNLLFPSKPSYAQENDFRQEVRDQGYLKYHTAETCACISSPLLGKQSNQCPPTAFDVVCSFCSASGLSCTQHWQMMGHVVGTVLRPESDHRLAPWASEVGSRSRYRCFKVHPKFVHVHLKKRSS